uniref:Uncharacterized protein n=1 Tax=Rhizophora mucronata TaxID=61149 RepID=A0A2P2NQX2_RHIMU
MEEWVLFAVWSVIYGSHFSGVELVSLTNI